MSATRFGLNVMIKRAHAAHRPTKNQGAPKRAPRVGALREGAQGGALRGAPRFFLSLDTALAGSSNM